MKIYGGELVASGSSIAIPVTGLATTGSNIFNGNQVTNGNKTINGNLIVTGSLTAQQFIVSSSVTYLTTSFSSGSTKFGDSIDDTHQFTGSLSVSGSQTINGTLGVSIGGVSELNVQQTGVILGNVVTDTHRVTGSLNVSGSIATTGTLDGNIISANSAGSTQIFLKSTGAGSNRQWQIQSNETAAGDLSFMQSTAAGGSTYATKFNLTPTGAATFGSSVTATNLYLGTLTNEQLMVSGTGSRGIGVSTITSGDPFVRLYDNTTIKADIWWGRSGNYMGINSLGSGSITAINPNGGNVLIGTTTDAGYKLDVNGYGRFSNQLLLGNFNGEALKFQSATSTGSTYLRFYNSAATSRGYFGLFWSGTADYMVLDSGALEMNFGSSNKFTFTGGGTATFSGLINANFQTVAANGSINVESLDPAIRFRVTSGTANSRIYEWRAVAAGGVNDRMELRLWNDAQSSASTLFTVSSVGNVTITGTLTENSSIRYKNDIETVKFGLDKVLQMRGVTYTKKNTGLKELGLIAEEINQILPEAVLKNEEGEPDSVSYGRLTAVLIEAIKELKIEIEELKLNR